MNLCKDCVYFVEEEEYPREIVAYCTHLDAQVNDSAFDPIYGKPSFCRHQCKDGRAVGGWCGLWGELFEPKNELKKKRDVTK